MKHLKNNIFVICSFAMFFVFMLAYNLNQYVSNLDELWNYNTASQILYGLTPYSQISMITTPLLPTIVALIMSFTSNNLIVFRVIATILACLNLFMVYMILGKLNKNKIANIIITGIIGFTYYGYFALDYNFFVLVIFLIIEYMQIIILQKRDEKQKLYWDIVIGFLAGLAICTKQTLGLAISAYVIFVELVFTSKKDVKKYLVSITWRMLGIAVPVIVFLLYLICTGSFADFINYAVLGIKTFSNSVPYSNLFETQDMIVSNLSVIVPACIIITIVCLIAFKAKNKSKEKIRNTEILAISSLPMLIVMYPISDSVHFLIGVLPALILIAYLIIMAIKYVCNSLDNKTKQFVIVAVETFCILIGFVKIGIGIFNNFEVYSKAFNNTNLEHYQNVPVFNNFEERIDTIKSFVQEKKEQGYDVIIADAEACVYDIPMNIYHKNYDMFLKGNIGKDGEDGIINDIENSHNTIYLIKKDGQKLNWQTPTKVLNYIRENLELDGTIDIFEIYKKE